MEAGEEKRGVVASVCLPSAVGRLSFAGAVRTVSSAVGSSEVDSSAAAHGRSASGSEIVLDSSVFPILVGGTAAEGSATSAPVARKWTRSSAEGESAILR